MPLQVVSQQWRAFSMALVTKPDAQEPAGLLSPIPAKGCAGLRTPACSSTESTTKSTDTLCMPSMAYLWGTERQAPLAALAWLSSSTASRLAAVPGLCMASQGGSTWKAGPGAHKRASSRDVSAATCPLPRARREQSLAAPPAPHPGVKLEQASSKGWAWGRAPRGRVYCALLAVWPEGLPSC